MREAVATATGDPALADRAARLIVACDAVRYSGRFGAGDRADELEDAPDLFRALARDDRPAGDGRGRKIDDARR